MYQGKHINAKRNAPSKRARRFRKEFVVLCSIAVLLCGMIGGTLAYLFATTSEVKNSFVPAEVPPSVTEKWDNETKENVKFKNDGNVNAYIRANIIVYWEDDEHNVVANPAGHKYEIRNGNSSKWVEGSDGYYYFTEPVAPGDYTDILIEYAAPTAGNDYHLVIDVLCESIQAEPPEAVTQAWGVTVANDGTISK